MWSLRTLTMLTTFRAIAPALTFSIKTVLSKAKTNFIRIGRMLSQLFNTRALRSPAVTKKIGLNLKTIELETGVKMLRANSK